MKLVGLTILVLLVYGVVAPPVTEPKKKSDHHLDDNEVTDEDQVANVEYKRYLQEVVSLLEGNPAFKAILLNATHEQIKSGDIAEHIPHDFELRSKLDESKRRELARLNKYRMQQYDHENGIDRKHLKIVEHIDLTEPDTFGPDDLRKLIVHTTKELEAADIERRKEFKEYEMKKELTYEEQLKHLDEKNRAEAQKQHEQMQQKHNEHVPIHHPGSKHQLEQVWEEQDHLTREDFNPKTFFHLHDLDGNGVWDPYEVKALFRKELDKIYDPNAPEDDVRERFEEMERMREHVFNESDTNNDNMISYKEFLEQTKRKEFEEDGWDPIDQKEHPIFTDEEYRMYAQQHGDEIARMIDQGLIPAAPPGYVPLAIPPNQMYLQQPPGSMAHHQQYAQPHIPGPGAMHPNGIPQGQFPPHVPQQAGGYHPNDHIPQGHFNPPPAQFHQPDVQGSYNQHQQAQHHNQQQVPVPINHQQQAPITNQHKEYPGNHNPQKLVSNQAPAHQVPIKVDPNPSSHQSHSAGGVPYASAA